MGDYDAACVEVGQSCLIRLEILKKICTTEAQYVSRQISHTSLYGKQE